MPPAVLKSLPFSMHTMSVYSVLSWERGVRTVKSAQLHGGKDCVHFSSSQFLLSYFDNQKTEERTVCRDLADSFLAHSYPHHLSVNI